MLVYPDRWAVVSIIAVILSALLICLWVNDVAVSIWKLETSSLALFFILFSVYSYLMHRKQRAQSIEQLKSKSQKILDESQKEAEHLKKFLNAKNFKN